MRIASRPLVRRLAFMDEQIRAGHYPNAVSLARTLEIHPRTVLRDLEFLRDSCLAPLEFCRRRNGYYYGDRNFALPLFRLTEGELVALFASSTPGRGLESRDVDRQPLRPREDRL